MTVAAYGRVSTDKKDQLNSFENQHNYFEREIQARGHTLYRIYADKGLTGTKLNNRPEFEEMLTDAGIDIKVLTDNARDGRKHKKHTVYEISDRQPLFNEVWIKNTSRFARNTLSYEIITLLRIKGVNIFFIEQNINSNDPTQDIMLKLMQIFDEQDSKDKSSKVRFGNTEGANRNVIRTNSKIYGYNYIQSENRLVSIPDEADVVRKIFELYSQGIGTRRICSILTSEGILTRAGNPFSTNTLFGILSNEKYTGYNNPLKLDTGIVFAKHSNPKIRESYQILECDRIDPIVSIKLFEKCRKQLESKTSHEKKGVYFGLSKYANLLWCKECGAKLYSNKNGKSAYYVCKTKRLHGKDACKSLNIYVRDIDIVIKRFYNTKFNSAIDKFREDAISESLDNIEKMLSLAKREHNDTGEYSCEIEEMRIKLESYYELYANTRSNKDAVRVKIDSCEAQLDDLVSNQTEQSLSDEEIKARLTRYLMRYNELYKHSKSFQLKESDIVSMITKIVVGQKNGKPEFTTTFRIFGDIEITIEDDLSYSYAGKSRVDPLRAKQIIDEAEKFIYGNV